MKTKLLLGIAGVAAIAGAGALYLGYPQADAPTTGTIGAATRYQAQQISENDVTLADAGVQDFLQSDTFDKLMKDENTLKLLSDSAFRSALADAEFRTALADPGFALALKAAQEKDRGAQLGGGTAGVDLGTNLRMLQARNEAASSASNAASGIHKAQKGGLMQALSNPDLRAALASPEFSAALQNQAFQSALAHSAFAAALQSQQFVAAAGLGTVRSDTSTTKYQVKSSK